MELTPRALIMCGCAVAAFFAATGLKHAFGGRTDAERAALRAAEAERSRTVEGEELAALLRAAGELGAKMGAQHFRDKGAIEEVNELAPRLASASGVPAQARAIWVTQFREEFIDAWSQARGPVPPRVVPSWEIPSDSKLAPLKRGMTEAQVIAAIGEPTIKSVGLWLYQGNGHVLFAFGKVAKVTTR
jgi:hypothetical protein